MICRGNRTEWSTIQGAIGRKISNQPSALREADSLPEIREKMAAKPAHYTQQWRQNSIRNVWENIVFR